MTGYGETGNFDDIGAGLSLVNEQLMASYGPAIAAANSIEDAYGQLCAINDSGNNATNLGEAIGLLKKAHEELRLGLIATIEAANQSLITVATYNTTTRLDEIGGAAVGELVTQELVITEVTDSSDQRGSQVESETGAHEDNLAVTAGPHYDQAEDIHRLIDQGEDPTQIPGYYDVGSTCFVYRGPGGTLIKVPRAGTGIDEPPPGTLTYDYIKPLIRGQGVSGLEQIIDYIPDSPEHVGSVRVQEVPGRNFDELSDEERDQIPLDHFRQLREIAEEAALRGI